MAKARGAASSKPAETKPVKPTPGDSLASALAAVRTARFAEALGPLLEAWRAQPSAKLAEVIASVSGRAAVAAPSLRGKTAAALEAWTKLGECAGLAELPALLASLADAPSKQAIARLAYVARWMPDPRVDDMIVALLETVPYRATSTQPFWTRLFSLAEQITDPRQLARIENATADGVAVTMAQWLRVRIGRLHETLAPTLGGPHDEPAILDELAALLGPRKHTARTQNLEAILQAVHDAPDDDGPRLVYADALLERGDPRGELIALQLAPAQGNDREQRKREKELLDAHGKQWLGELAPVVMAGYRFERGFLAECRVENRHLDRVRKVVGKRAWSTVRTIAGSAAIALHPVMRSLRSLSFVSYEARNHEELPDSWEDLLVGSERPIEVLRYGGIESDRHWEDALERNQSVRPGVQGRWIHVPLTSELDALCQCTALPRLRELVVVEDPELVAEALFASPVMRRLETFGIVFDSRSDRRNPLHHFTAALRDAPVATLKLELGSYHTTTLQLERGARGYERLAMTVGPTMRSNWSEQLVNEAIAILDALGPSLRELRVTVRRQTDPKQTARLRAAAAQMKLDISEIG
jgi:uncharacterized protein (TIGR02996 family)